MKSKKFGKFESLLEIMIMIISIIAFSYILSPHDIVQAASVNYGCCEKTKQGAICQDVLQEQCQDGFSIYTSCQNTGNCKPGCCISSSGLCSVNSPKAKCEADGGAWQDSADCNLAQCKRGCCVLGIQTVFTTDAECDTLSKFYSLQKDFRAELGTEIQCLALGYQDVEGACIYQQANAETCKFNTQQECNKIADAKFEIGKFCSSVVAGCTKESTKKCIAGKDEVYWFDSCGNKEDVAETCDRFTGTTCGYNAKGEAYCKDLDCHDVPEKLNGGRSERKNGESWCVYESTIGEGKDVPGTSHYKYSCIDGDAKKEMCSEGRTEICVEDETETNNIKFSQAKCMANAAVNCIQLNIQKQEGEITEQEFDDKCKELSPYCQMIELTNKIKILNLYGIPSEKEGLNPALKLCAPNYSRGFMDRNSDEATASCAIGSYACMKVDTFEWGKWSCDKGCLCGSEDTKKLANEWCKSLGDCGAYTNIEKKVTDTGLRIKVEKYKDVEKFWSNDINDRETWTENLAQSTLDSYKSYAGFVQGQKINLSAVIEAISEVSGTFAMPTPGSAEEQAWLDDALGAMLGIGGGAAIGGTLLVGGLTKANLVFFLTKEIGGFWSNFFYVVMTTAIGTAVGYLIGKMFDGAVGPETINILTLIGTIGGAWTGIAGLPGVAANAGVVALHFFIALLIIAFFASLFGAGYATTTYTYECHPWEPPRGGSDCGLCNTKYNETCTAYKCSTLGTACKWSDAERCYAEVDDHRLPSITPWTSKLQESGFSISETTAAGIKIAKNSSDGCVNQYEQVTLGIDTHEDSHCKYDFSSKDYDAMTNDFDTKWGLNHSVTRSFSVLEKGEQNIFVRCIDRTGNKNNVDYIIRMCVNEQDISAPAVISSSPFDNSYIKYGSNSLNLTIFVNEPAECRWSLTDKDFGLMENKFANFLLSIGYLWPQSATITGLTKDNNPVFIRCNDSNGYTNAESITLTFLKSSSALAVAISSPESGADAVFGKTVDVLLKATTSGGVDSKATCSYGFKDYNSGTPFFTTGDTEHEQHLTLLPAGQHKIYVKCIDAAGNIAKADTTFKIKVDRQAPRITNVYKQADNLYVETDDDSSCAFTHDGCNFDFGSGVAMTGTSKEHTTTWKTGKTYYIKCEDLWGNIPDGCSITVKTIV